METQDLLLTNRYLQDLNPLIAGWQECDPGHRFGPHIRRYTLLHYVEAGSGALYSRGGVWPVSAGQMFVILPGEVTTYVADMNTPWHYRWVGFDGRLAQRFAQLPPVVDVDGRLFQILFHPDKSYVNQEYIIAGGLFRLYGELFPSEDRVNDHVKKVENYIRGGYMHHITVEAVAKSLNLDRRYLSRLFKQKTGSTVQEYLIRVRMEEADRCLCSGHSVQETAALCGYTDVANFSRMFKKHFGHSPAFHEKNDSKR